MPASRRIREYLGAMGADAAADALFYLTLGWVAAHSGGAVSAGVVLAAAAVPQLAMMLLGGAAGDRFGLIRAAGVTLAVRTLLFAGFVVMLASGRLSLWPLVAMSAAVGLVDALHMPAMGGVAGLLAGPGEQAPVQGAVSATTRVSGVAATTLGGVLLAWSLASAGVAMVVLSAAALVLLLMLRRSAPPASAASSVAEPGQRLVALVRDGLVTVGRDPHIRLILVLFTLANLAATAPVMLGVPLKGAAHQWSPVGYGLAMMGFALGSALGAVAVARWGKSVSDNIAAAVALLVPASAGLGALAVVDRAWQVGVAVFVVGLALAPAAALMMGEVRERVPSSHMGRVSSIVQLAIFGLIPLGHILFGWLAQRWDLRVAGMVMAVTLVTTVVLGWLWRRALDRLPASLA